MAIMGTRTEETTVMAEVVESIAVTTEVMDKDMMHIAEVRILIMLINIPGPLRLLPLHPVARIQVQALLAAVLAQVRVAAIAVVLTLLIHHLQVTRENQVRPQVRVDPNVLVAT
jgi:hypothetical protein